MDSKNCCDSSCLITPPKGFVPPEGTDAGKPFDMVCTFEPVEGGKLKLTKLGDTDMGKDENDDEGKEQKQESKPDYSGYAQGIMGGMGGQQGGQSPA